MVAISASDPSTLPPLDGRQRAALLKLARVFRRIAAAHSVTARVEAPRDGHSTSCTTESTGAGSVPERMEAELP